MSNVRKMLTGTKLSRRGFIGAAALSASAMALSSCSSGIDSLFDETDEASDVA